MKTGYKVLDAMTQAPITISPDTTIKDCARLMREEHIGGIPVSKNGELKGIITEQDIVRKVVALGYDINQPVSKVMVKRVITIRPDKDIYDALVKMRDHGIRHLPVVKGKKLIGLLTVKDVLKIQPQLFELLAEKYRLREEARKPVFTQNTSGICQVCGVFTDKLYEVDGVLMCAKCKRAYLKSKK